MALITCNECGSEISDKADVCINCGCPIEEEVEKSKESRITRLIIMILLAIIIVGVYRIYSDPTDDKFNVANVFKLITNQTDTLYDDEMQLQEDQYRAFPVELEKSAEINIEYNILYGTNIDVYFLTSTDYDKWIKMNNGTNEDISYHLKLSTFGLPSSSNTQMVEKGTYYIVLDNTDYGATYPPMNFQNDISTLDFLVNVKY